MVNQKMLEAITKRTIEFVIATNHKKRIGDRNYSFLLSYGTENGALKYAEWARSLGYNSTVKEHTISAGDESFVVYNVYVARKK